jgi:hypothetical protein
MGCAGLDGPVKGALTLAFIFFGKSRVLVRFGLPHAKSIQNGTLLARPQEIGGAQIMA